MKQKGVTKEALSIIKNEYQIILDSEGLTHTKAFVKPANSIRDISISGRTLRKIFNGKQVHINTITMIIKELGKEWFLNNNKIDIKNEADNSSSTGATDGEAVSKEG